MTEFAAVWKAYKMTEELQGGTIVIEPKRIEQVPESMKTKCPHKKTDFRYKMWVKERKVQLIFD